MYLWDERNGTGGVLKVEMRCMLSLPNSSFVSLWSEERGAGWAEGEDAGCLT